MFRLRYSNVSQGLHLIFAGTYNIVRPDTSQGTTYVTPAKHFCNAGETYVPTDDCHSSPGMELLQCASLKHNIILGSVRQVYTRARTAYA